MTFSTKFPPEPGAWFSDWEPRLYGRLHERGFSSVTGFVDSRPGVSLLELAKDLGPSDIAAVQMKWALVKEAADRGDMERCARSLLVRFLRHSLPEGWHREWKDIPGDPSTPLFRKVGAFASLTVALPDEYDGAAERVRLAFDAADLPEGWLPVDTDDPVVVEIFRRHWPAPA